MTILEANSKLVRCGICGSSGRISGKRFFGVVCVDDFEKNAVYDDCRGYYLSHGTHGTSFIYDTIEEAVEAWNIKHKSIESTKRERQVKEYSNVGAVCYDCARAAGFKQKDKAVGVWVDECGICHEKKPCTSLHHDWIPPHLLKEGGAE